MRVLLILDNAPDYRETFLRTLAGMVDLTVFGRRCEDVGLVAPVEREGYSYQDLRTRKLGGLFVQPELFPSATKGHWDLVCCDLNLRYISRLRVYRFYKRWEIPFVWRGQIYGRNDGLGLKRLKGGLLRRGEGCLVYSEPIKNRVWQEFHVDAESYNNTEVSYSEFRRSAFPSSDTLNLLFVGRYQERKCLDRLLRIAERIPWVRVRFVGPGMDALIRLSGSKAAERVEIFGRAVGRDLDAHFDWAHLVANPGHVGLLVMNAARHGKGILIDSSSEHAPEYFLAEVAKQPFVDFRDELAVDRVLALAYSKKEVTRCWGEQLQKVATREYTVEHMASKHHEVFRTACRESSRKRAGLFRFGAS